jgi:hypothetical protein
MISTIISSLALIISFGTMWVLYKNRLESNRPIVTALVEGDVGNISTPMTLKIYNTGNTPALDVRLKTDKEKLKEIIIDRAPNTFVNDIYKSFSEDRVIPVLHNGSYVENAFGVISDNENSTLKCGSSIDIEIEYKNLYGHTYRQKQKLRITPINNLTGTLWKKGRS